MRRFQKNPSVVYERFLEGSDLAYAKIIMARGLAATPGVEGFYSIERIKVILMIMLHLLLIESPVDVVDVSRLVKVGLRLIVHGDVNNF